MTDLKDLLDSVADRAAPIEDLADRAVTGAIRRRRRTMIVAPLVAAAVAAAALLIPTQLQNRGMEPVRPSPTAVVRPKHAAPEVDIRYQDQPALPGRIAQPATLSYAVACTRRNPCKSPWRLQTADGKQWNVPAAAGNGTVTGVLSVAPNGKRIAYLTKHPHNGSGYLVVRDLASGAEDRPLDFPAARIDDYSTRLTWSPDSRWIGIEYRLKPGSDDAEGKPKATLVDTTTMDTAPLSYPCCLPGLPNHTAGWVALFPQIIGGLSADQTMKVDQSGAFAGELPAAISDNVSDGAGQTLISPDASVFATISRHNGGAELAVVDTSTGTVSSTRRLDGLGGTAGTAFELLGWTDSHTVLTLVLPGTSTAGLYAIDIRDGRARLTYEFPHPPARLSVASRGPTGGNK